MNSMTCVNIFDMLLKNSSGFKTFVADVAGVLLDS